MAFGVILASQHVVMHATFNLDSQLSFWGIEIQNVGPNPVLPAKLHAKVSSLQAMPKTFLCGCCIMTKLLAKSFLVRQIVDFVHRS